MRLIIALICAAAILTAPAQAQEEPETKTGSRLQAEPEPIKTNPKTYDVAKSRRVAKKFGSCLYDRRSSQSMKLLTVSDYWAIDYANLGDAEYLLGNRILMEQCLGRVGRAGTSGIGMQISNTAIRASLAEAAYLEVYGDQDEPIAIDPGAPEFLPNRFLFPVQLSRTRVRLHPCQIVWFIRHLQKHTRSCSRSQPPAKRRLR